jgi:drug/metabolite transporter (DMT)-like permease
MWNSVFLLVLAMSLTPGLDGIAKTLSSDYSPFFVTFLRYLSAGCVALIAAKLAGQKIHVPKKGRLGQVWRTALLVGAMTCLITALSMVPMAQAVGGFLISPLVATFLCIWLYKEKLTVQRAAGAILSLAGAVIISRPEAAIETGSVFALMGGGLLGAYLAATRGAVQSGGVLSSLTVQCFLAAILISPLAFLSGPPQITGTLVFSVLGLGVLSAIAHSLTVAAFERTDASILSPFLYFNLIAAIGVGFFWFNEVPSNWAMLGLCAIAGGGLITILPAFRLRRLRVA